MCQKDDILAPFHGTRPQPTLIYPALGNEIDVVTSGLFNRMTYLKGAFWQNGNAVELPFTSPKSINDRGHVLGVADAPEVPPVHGTPFYVGIWNGARFLPFASIDLLSTSRPLALNNADEIAGTWEWDPGGVPSYAVVATPPRYTRIGNYGEAYDLNDRGDVIGKAIETRLGRFDSYVILAESGQIWSRTCALACCR